MTPHKAWRVAYIDWFMVIMVLALGILLAGEDCPNSKWANRHVIIPASSTESVNKTSREKGEKFEQVNKEANQTIDAVDEAEGEVIVTPTLKEASNVLFSLQTLALGAPYACSFGKGLHQSSFTSFTKNFRC